MLQYTLNDIVSRSGPGSPGEAVRRDSLGWYEDARATWGRKARSKLALECRVSGDDAAASPFGKFNYYLVVFIFRRDRCKQDFN